MTRLLALASAGLCLVVALGLRWATGRHATDSSGALAQFSGTALYAAMTYAGVFVLRPRTTPPVAAAAALLFCWAIEFLQLTGIPATLSAHSTLARLALGTSFDPVDLLWYVVGVLPIAALHRWLRGSR